MNEDILTSLQLSFVGLWGDVLSFLPEIILSIVIVVIGWIIGSSLSQLVERLFNKFKFDKALDAAGVDDLTARAGYKFRPGHFVGALVKWFIILVFIVAALDILRLDQVTVFFREVALGYLPKVIVSVLILLGASVLANVASASVVAGARAAGYKSSELLGSVTRYSVLLFAVLAVLNQLEIAPELVQTLFTGIVFAASLAVGLAFGLGGKEAASGYIRKMTGGGDVGGHHHH
jgi:flagellar biosynthesis protein FliQ